MKYCKLLVLIILLTGCCDNIAGSLIKAQTEADFVRLSFIARGKVPSICPVSMHEDYDAQGNISFAWGNVTLILSDGEKALPAYSFNSSCDTCTYTGLFVDPLEDDSSCAEFESVRFYSQSDLSRALRCYAVSGGCAVGENDALFSYDFEVPELFTQTKNQDSSFLKDYVYTYAVAPFQGNRTLLDFNHIPAYFRFIIDNESPTSAILQNVSIFLSDQTDYEKYDIASAKATAAVDISQDNISLSYGADAYDTIVTELIGDDIKLNVGKRYTAYSMALPLGDDDAFSGKILNFQVQTSNLGTITYQISADEFAQKNAGVFNWIGGKSYTVRFRIGGDSRVSGMMNADNDIEIVSQASGVYTLKYIDADGNALDYYSDICTLTVDDVAVYDDFVDVNIAPIDASAIGIYDSDMSCVSSIAISSIASEFVTPSYTFGILSDIHLTVDNTNKCQDKYQAALTFFNENNVDFTCICGDISEKGTAEEYAVYEQMTTSFSLDSPVYTTSGNHDAGERINHSDWKEYTGNEVVFDFYKSLPDGRKDHFLFFGMSYWSRTGAYTEEHLKWLEGKLSEYKGERCFIITHMFFPDMAGNMNAVYSPSNWLEGPLLERLQALCNDNPNTIWFSGHSHWKWALQKFDDKANVYRTYDDGKPSSGWSVHIPSCAKPIDSDGQSREARTQESEGAIIKVYEDYIDVHGVDFINSLYLPIATYRLYTSFY